jgi:hypothetical protein
MGRLKSIASCVVGTVTKSTTRTYSHKEYHDINQFIELQKVEKAVWRSPVEILNLAGWRRAGCLRLTELV